MQEIKIYVMAAESLGVVRDYANSKNAGAPILVRGVETVLKLRLFSAPNVQEPYPIDKLSNISAWQFVMDSDFDESTNVKIQADNENIRVDSVVDTVDDTEYNYTEISIPLKHTNTVELDEWLGNGKSKNGLTGELVGYDADGNTVFLLQLENFSVRNRITSAGEPTEIESDWLNEAQVRAFVLGTLRNPVEFQFSVDGTSDWHENQTTDDKFYRQRIANINAEWSAAVMMAPGQKGEPGKDGTNGKDGTDGHTPVRGTDYWTDADKAEIKSYVYEAILNGEW